MAVVIEGRQADRRAGPSPETKQWRRLSAAVLVLSVLPFAVVLGGELVWDDRMLTDGSAIGGGRSLLRCFTEPFLWHFFRPLVSVSFFFERMLWHGEPLGYHLTNLFIHVAGTAVMIRLLHEAFRSRWTGILGGLFFAIHPVQVGAVAWIGGRTDSLATLWVLLFALMLIRSAKAPAQGGGTWLALSVIFFNLALYTKEQCLPLVLLVPAAYAAWRPESGVRLPRTGLFCMLPFLASVLLFLVGGYYLGMPRPSTLPYGPWEIARLAGATITYYTFLLVSPTPSWMHRLSLEGFQALGIWPSVVGFLIVGAAVASLLALSRRAPACAWFLGMTILLFLPVSNIVPLPFIVAAPYRGALPWIGLAAILGYVFGRAMEYTEAAPVHARGTTLRLLAASLLFLAIWYSGLSAWGAYQWRRETRLFSTIIRYDPESIVATSVYSYSLEREKRYREAARIEEATLDRVFGSDAWRDEKQAMEAITADPRISFRARRNQGTGEDPRIWIAGLYAQLASCLQKAGENEAAYDMLLVGDRIWSNHARIHLGLGYFAAVRGDYPEAVRRYRMALAIDKENIAANSGLGYSYAGMERWGDAAGAFRRWAQLDPDSREARDRLREADERLRQSSR